MPPRTKRYVVLWDENNPNVALIGVKDRSNPYTGQQDSGYGAGYPAVPGGNAEGMESPQQTLAREIKEELLDRYELTSLQADVVTNTYRNTTYETYTGTGRENPNPQPDLNDPAYRENITAGAVDVTQLGLPADATQYQILTGLAEHVGSETKPWRLEPAQQQQFQMYTAADNYPLQEFASQVQQRLQAQQQQGNMLAQVAAMGAPGMTGAPNPNVTQNAAAPQQPGNQHQQQNNAGQGL
ncbi:NUDIX domain-containing protein [Streptomyces sp. CA-135486]|uniref:NUDIX domain-containing protein n=1 Tax=Streptomyces sp. CA-135486 TaxID=3240049 RepID=UPI003D8BE5D8